MQVEQKEIVLIDYFFSDFKGSKVRPAIVVSNDYLNNLSEDCLIIPLTTILKKMPYSLILSQEDLIEGILEKVSRARVDKVSPIKKDLIIARIGKINDNTFSLIKKELFNLF